VINGNLRLFSFQLFLSFLVALITASFLIIDALTAVGRLWHDGHSMGIHTSVTDVIRVRYSESLLFPLTLRLTLTL